MYSERKNSGRGKHTERLENIKDRFNLSVCGSSAQIHDQPLKTVRPNKNSNYTSKRPKRKEFPFPVDKIIYLTQRLELTSLTDNKIETISVSSVDVKGQTDRELFHHLKKDNSRSFASPVDFSLDLSSISNTGDDSDVTSEEEDNFCTDESCGRPENECRGPPHTSIDTKRTPDDECERRKRKACDLINVYVNSVTQEKEILKYLRPCRTCKQTCCVCPESPTEVNDYLLDEAAGFQDATSNCCPYLGGDCCHVCCPLALPLDECSCSNYESNRTSSGSVPSEIQNYSSSLASAARSARVLARDLELILSNLNNESV